MRKKQLGVVCIKVVVEGKGGDESTKGVVYMMKSRGLRTEPQGTPSYIRVRAVVWDDARDTQRHTDGINIWRRLRLTRNVIIQIR